jgi:hypothetical protein
VVAISRFAPDGFVWPIAAVLLAGVLLGALQVVAEADPAANSAGVPIESVLLPGAAALAALGAIRLVPIGLALVPAVVLAGGLVGLALVTELRLARASGPPSSTDRTAVLIQILLVGFFGFAGVAVLVAAIGMVGLGLVVVNAGALFRIRYVFWMMLIVLAAEGLRKLPVSLPLWLFTSTRSLTTETQSHRESHFTTVRT